MNVERSERGDLELAVDAVGGHDGVTRCGDPTWFQSGVRRPEELTPGVAHAITGRPAP